MPHSIRTSVVFSNGLPLRRAGIIRGMDNPGNIIKAVREEKHLSQAELAQKAKVHLNTLRDIEKYGGVRSGKLVFLAEALGLDLDALSRGRRVNLAHGDAVTIPQFDTAGKMGNGGVVLSDEPPGVIEQWRTTEEWLHRNVRGFTSTKNLCIVTGFGDSMSPLFRPGDPLIVDVGVREVLYDAVYFFRVGDMGYIKRLQRVPAPNGARRLLVKSDNPSYETWEITPDMEFEVFGRVLKAWVGTAL